MGLEELEHLIDLEMTCFTKTVSQGFKLLALAIIHHANTVASGEAGSNPDRVVESLLRDAENIYL